MANPVTGGMKRMEVAAANKGNKKVDTCKGEGKSKPKMAVKKKMSAKIKGK